jgi:two-component system cell cycle sensor histidine kinase PleC
MFKVPQFVRRLGLSVAPIGYQATEAGRQPGSLLAVQFVAAWIAAAVLAGFLGVVFYKQLEQTAIEEASEQVASELRRLETEVSARLQTLAGIGVAAQVHSSEILTRTKGDNVPSEGHFNRSIAQQFPDLRTIIAVGADGIIRNDTRPGEPGVGIKVSDRPYFQVFRSSDAPSGFVSEPVISRVDGKVTWVLSLPLTGPDDGFAGVTVVSVDRRYFAGVFEKASGIQGAHFLLVHANGTIMESSTPSVAPVGGTLSDNATLQTVDGAPPLRVNLIRGTDSASEDPTWFASLVAVRDDLYLAARRADYRSDILTMVLSFLLLFTALSVFAYRAAAANVRARHPAEEAGRVAEDARMEAELASNAKSGFLANVSHELRTPLNAILGYSQLIEHLGIDRLEKAKLGGYIGDINTSAQRLLELVNDVLDISKIESGAFRVSLTAADPSKVVARAVQPFELTANARRIALDLKTETTARALCDDRALVQSLSHLVSNAIKFSPDGATVTLRVYDEADHVVFAVLDEGSGISEEILENLGAPFSRSMSPELATTEGTGLGLSIAKGLTERQNGYLTVARRPVKGTAARIGVPVAPDGAGPDDGAPENAEPDRVEQDHP